MKIMTLLNLIFKEHDKTKMIRIWLKWWIVTKQINCWLDSVPNEHWDWKYFKKLLVTKNFKKGPEFTMDFFKLKLTISWF